jgi:hypothetical protein
MTTHSDILKVAAAEIGTAEKPAGSNKTKYGKWYGMDGVAWCAIFISWVTHAAGAKGLIPKFAYTPSGAEWFRRRKLWHETPEPGDVAFFDFPGDGVDRISHVGFVESVRASGDIVTIEGNTSTTDNRNGGMVMRRVRNPKYVVGYGRPKYEREARQKPPRAASRPMPLLRHGSDGGAVRTLQEALNEHGAHLIVDGDFGDDTLKAVIAFQTGHKLAHDGVVGRHTWEALGL